MMRAESREQRAENCSGHRFKCQEAVNNSDCKLHNSKGKPWDLQHAKHGKRCCYGNYKGIVKVDVEIAMTIMARDCRGISGGYTPSNLVIEIYD